MRTKPILRLIQLGLCLAAMLYLPACYLDDASMAYADAGYGPGVAGGYDVVIRSDSDFYGPLSAYGAWEAVDGYGQCWVPGGVGADWQPYEDGMWVSTDAGWYWQSDEPWGWATYHYGRWVDAPRVGWCWIPGTRWAPAWVAWCDQGDAIGWAPLPPERGFFAGGFWRHHDDDDRRHFVFVPRRDFQRRVNPADVERFRAAVIARAGPAASFQVSTNGPSRVIIEQASGRPVPTVSAQDERRRTDAVVVSRWRRPGDLPAVEARPADRRTEPRKRPATPAMANPAPAARPAPPPVAPVERAAAPPRAESRRERREEAPPPPRLAAPPPRAAAAPPAAGVAPMRAPPAAVRPAPPPAPPPKAPPPRREKRDDHQPQ